MLPNLNYLFEHIHAAYNHYTNQHKNKNEDSAFNKAILSTLCCCECKFFDIIYSELSEDDYLSLVYAELLKENNDIETIHDAVIGIVENITINELKQWYEANK